MKKYSFIVAFCLVTNVFTLSAQNIYPSTGDVGLGTTSPTAKLDVVGLSGTIVKVRGGSAPGNVALEVNNSGVIGILESVIGTPTQVRVGSRNNYAFSLFTNNLDRLTILSSNGNVGINTLNPAYKLDVNGSINATSFYVNGVAFTSGGSQWTTSGSDIYFSSPGSGRVGIATSTPGAMYKLDVNGFVNAAGFYVNGVPISGGGTGSQWTTSGSNIFYNTGTVGINTTAPNTAYRLDVNGIINATSIYQNGVPLTTAASQWTTSGTSIYYNGSGSVGIGTTSPGATYKLAVAGKIGAWGEVMVFNNGSTFPDYVFDKDYKLMSLKEIQTYIKEHHHLPEVPSADEIKQQGMGLSEMNVILLKKVEEITLHLIEMEKNTEAIISQNGLIKAEYEQIKKKLEALEIKK